jgi:hypothetical protein
VSPVAGSRPSRYASIALASTVDSVYTDYRAVPGLANPTPAYLASLPSDPVALLATIRWARPPDLRPAGRDRAVSGPGRPVR